MGNVLQDQGELDNAISAYQMAVSIKPDNAEIHFNIGNAHKNKREFREATIAYNKALSLIFQIIPKPITTLEIPSKNKRNWTKPWRHIARRCR